MNEGLKIEVARARLNAAKALLADVLEARGMEDGLPPFDLVCELRTFFAERGLKIGYPHPFEEGPGGDPRVEDEGGDADLWSTLADDMVNAIGREAATKLVAEALDAAEPTLEEAGARVLRAPEVPNADPLCGQCGHRRSSHDAVRCNAARSVSGDACVCHAFVASTVRAPRSADGQHGDGCNCSQCVAVEHAVKDSRRSPEASAAATCARCGCAGQLALCGGCHRDLLEDVRLCVGCGGDHEGGGDRSAEAQPTCGTVRNDGEHCRRPAGHNEVQGHDFGPFVAGRGPASAPPLDHRSIGSGGGDEDEAPLGYRSQDVVGYERGFKDAQAMLDRDHLNVAEVAKRAAEAIRRRGEFLKNTGYVERHVAEVRGVAYWLESEAGKECIGHTDMCTSLEAGRR